MKELKDMTLRELWQLFPIELRPHNPQWFAWAEEEIAALESILAPYNPHISHIGSTAVPGIMAKPIVDLLVEVDTAANWDSLVPVMEKAGYICMARFDSRLSFNKGYTPAGYAARVFHIHLRRNGDNDEILFRDYLRAHPEVAKEYEALKISLLPAYRHNRDGYTDAKSPFVGRITEIARQEAQQ